MFGYFKFLKRYSNYETQRVYKNYYCGLCFALARHYGTLSRFLLSYDVTILAIALHAHKQPCCDKLSCVGCRKAKKDLFSDEAWKKLAAINILLAAEKFRDDIADEKSVKAAAGRLLFRRVIKKAQRDYPQIDETIRLGYRKIQLAEQANEGVLEIADRFGTLMTDTMDAAFTAPEAVGSYVREIARWLYFIDALDDYDEDIVKKRFNALKDETLSFYDYVSQKHRELQLILAQLFAKHNELVTALNHGSHEEAILISILRNTIPAATSGVLTKHGKAASVALKADSVKEATI